MDKKLGDYIIIEKIAHGGMAEVYKAKASDPLGIDRLVVIKRILPHISSQPEYVEMLVDEAKIAVHCSHGNIAQIYDLGRIGDDYFIVMEYVDGKTISQILRAFRDSGEMIPIDIAVYALLQVCLALDYIHKKKDASGKPLGIVHRDISPQNIIVSYSGTIKVIDFGVAKSLEKLNHTEAGVLKGKFAYMSPEQARGDFVDAQSDIFSIGILLWESLTQTRLFKRANNKETVKAVLKYKIPLPRDLRPDIPKALEKIIMKCLRRIKLFRYKEASDIAIDLDVFLHQYYPDFKPLRVAEFLYQNFGSEPDESHLPLEIKVPDKKLSDQTKRQKIQVIDVETKRTRLGHLNKRTRKIISITLALLLLSFIWFFIKPSTGRIVLEVSPVTSFVTLDEAELKRVPEGLYVIDVQADRDVNLLIQQNGYIDHEQTLQLMDGEIKKIQIRLLPVVERKAILLDSEPRCSELYFNDKPLNQACPFELKGIEVGQKVKIGFFLQDHVYTEKEILVTSDTEAFYKVNLDKLTASLQVESDPPGATVYLSGSAIGVTPLLKNIVTTDNNYNIRLLLEGYLPYDTQGVIKPGEKKVLSITLNKL